MKENIHKIFENWNETIIWSCLQGIMGEIHTNLSEDAAMAILGDFAFYAGNPSEELIRFKPESCKQDFIIMVPQNEEWAEIIECCFGEKAKKVTRYAIKKEPDVFDRVALQKVVDSLPKDYTLKMMDEELFWHCKEIGWCRDWISQYPDYEMYHKYGLGAIILKDGETMTEKEMKDYVNANMARHKVPKYIDFVDSFPMNAAGKILKYKMRQDAARELGLTGDGADTAGPGK